MGVKDFVSALSHKRTSRHSLHHPGVNYAIELEYDSFGVLPVAHTHSNCAGGTLGFLTSLYCIGILAIEPLPPCS